MTEAIAPEVLLRGAASWELMDTTSDAVGVFGVDGTLVYGNNAYQLLAHMMPAAMSGSRQGADFENYHSARPDMEGPPWETAIRHALGGESVPPSDVSLTRADGNPFWLNISAHPIRDQAGLIIGAMSISRDVSRTRALEQTAVTHEQQLRSMHVASETEIRRLVEAAEARAEELEAIINSMGDAVVITDEASGARRWNPAYTRLLGAPNEGETSVDRVHKFQLRDWDGNPVVPESMTAFRAVRDGAEAIGEYIITTQAGTEAYLRVQAAPLRDAGGKVRGAVIVLRDMTATRAADKQKDEFLSLVSHELRTPVTIIGGFTQVLRRSVEKADMRDMLRRLTTIERQVQQLTGLINDLLDLSRVEHGRFECSLAPLDHGALVRTVVDEMQQLNPSRAFALSLPGGLLVNGDAIRLRQVLVNLLDNAVKHGPTQSQITVTVEATEDEVTTYVCDGGPPLPFSERHRVFDRFYRIAPGPVRNGGSLGLGLYICRSIVESHAGRIWVADDNHSSFAFSLRRLPPPHTPEPRTPTSLR